MGFLRENILTMATLMGVVAGISLGLSLKSLDDGIWTARQAYYVGYPGKIFLNMLKCLIIPLIVPSLIASIGQLDLRVSGKIGSRAVLYYMTTTFLAVTLGIILTITIRPGFANSEEVIEKTESSKGSATDTLLDLFTNCFPPNLVQATMQQYKTLIVDPGNEVIEDSSTGAIIDPLNKETWKMTGSWNNSTNILGLVIFSVATGVAIALSGEEGKPLLSFFKSVSHVMMKVTNWVVHLAPVGVAFLIAGEILQMKSVIAELTKLAWYLFTVILGISIQGFVILPLIYGLVTKNWPFRFIGKMGPALATAFGTASSSATLPVTINSLEEGNKVDPRISRFVLPIGATINMDGTALYEAVAAIFIAQMTGMNPSLGQIIIISITATAASIGAAGIPHAGLVTLVMVLETVGLPSEAVSIIMSVDWLVDRVRTAVNVLGDAFGAAIVAHLSKDELEKLNDTEDNDYEMKDIEKSKLLEIENFDTIESFDTIEEKLTFAARQHPQDSVVAGSPAMSYSAQAGRAKSRCVEM
eukprot:GFUD01064099.1.p1 GENE.GFUD01064099.1~~GFUD01064099.1.p1  ORF type:complete len:528 (+),score=150.58 GFUD01064099.1:138-1721(+)